MCDSLYDRFKSNLNFLTSFDTPKTLGIAVSGGPDSVCLLMLAHLFAKQNPTELVVLTVNHNLRPEASKEIEYVQSLATSLGHQVFALEWLHDNNLSNLQSKAREARYSLMTSKCKSLNISTLLVGHHRDDCIENFLLRLSRKSSVLGLSTNNIGNLNNIRILRPLFNIKKQALISYLQEINIKWFEDKSNYSTKYRRSEIRQYLGQLSENEINKIEQQITHINTKAEVIKQKLVTAFTEISTISNYGFVTIDLEKYRTFPSDITTHVLKYLLTIVGGHKHLPRFASILKIVELLDTYKDFKRSLHGCTLKRISSKLLIYREYGRILPQDGELESHAPWDNRFKIKSREKLSDNYKISAFTMQDYIKLKNELDLTHLKFITMHQHIEILFTLPAIKKLEKIVALPHISWVVDDAAKNAAFEFCPAFTWRFIPFDQKSLLS